MPKQKIVKVGDFYLPETEANILIALALKAKSGQGSKTKKKLQVAAKPATNNPTDKFSKEATLPASVIPQPVVIGETEFKAQLALPPKSLEAGEDLPIGYPVTGTGKGTIYYVVAKAPGILVAMRWKGSQLSVRIAGSGLAAITERLTATGIFANHATEGYFSAHLGQQGNIDDMQGSVSAQMLYASVLAAIGADLNSFTQRAPYQWRNWTKVTATPAAA